MKWLFVFSSFQQMLKTHHVKTHQTRKRSVHTTPGLVFARENKSETSVKARAEFAKTSSMMHKKSNEGVAHLHNVCCWSDVDNEVSIVILRKFAIYTPNDGECLPWRTQMERHTVFYIAVNITCRSMLFMLEVRTPFYEDEIDDTPKCFDGKLNTAEHRHWEENKLVMMHRHWEESNEMM